MDRRHHCKCLHYAIHINVSKHSQPAQWIRCHNTCLLAIRGIMALRVQQCMCVQLTIVRQQRRSDIHATDQQTFMTHISTLLQNDDKTSRGFGFVNFEQVDSAQQAVDALHGKQVDDKELYVGRAQKKTEREAALKQRSVHKCLYFSLCLYQTAFCPTHPVQWCLPAVSETADLYRQRLCWVYSSIMHRLDHAASSRHPGRNLRRHAGRCPLYAMPERVSQPL